MAYTRNYTWILEHMKNNGYQNFAIYNDSAKKMLLMEEKTGHKTPEEAANLLSDVLQNMSGIVYVEISKKSRGETGGVGTPNHLIPVQLGEEKVAGIGSIQQPSQNFDAAIGALEKNFNDRLDAMRREMEHKREVEDLRKQLKEAQEGNPMVNAILPHVPQLISGIFGKTPAPIAGHPPAEVPAETVNEEYSEQEVEFASRQISRLLAVDPEFLHVLEKLADMAENEPSKYQMAKSFL